MNDIKELKDKYRFTQQELADFAGVKLRTYQKWEEKNRIPKAGRHQKLLEGIRREIERREGAPVQPGPEVINIDGGFVEMPVNVGSVLKTAALIMKSKTPYAEKMYNAICAVSEAWVDSQLAETSHPTLSKAEGER